MMDILLLSIKDLEKAEYLRKGNKNLLKTEFGLVGDTVALCGKLINAEKTNYGPRFWIKDNDKDFGIVAGTFNKKVRKDAKKILEKFKTGREEYYLLLYGSPYYQDKLYINVNQDEGVILVTKKTYEKFHGLREKSKSYLLKKLRERKREKERENGKKNFHYVEIFEFLKKKKKKEAKIWEIEKFFSDSGVEKNLVEKKILELLESGKAYEPKAGLIKLI